MKKITTLLLVYLICIGSMSFLISSVPGNVKAEDINPVWYETWGQGSISSVYETYVSGDNDYLYVTGVTETFVGIEPNNHDASIFILKYDTSGDLIWNQIWDKNEYDLSDGIIEYDGYLYLIGTTSSTPGTNDVLLLKYDTDGSLIWNKTWNGGRAYGIACYDNYLYIVGRINSDVVLWKYDTSGSLVWNKTWDGGKIDCTYNIISYSGYLYVTGYTNSSSEGSCDVLLLKYNTDGNLLWNKTWDGSDDEFGRDLIEVNGYLYIIGDKGYIPGDLPTSTPDSYDVFLLKYDLDGILIWNETWNGSDHSHAYGITEYNGELYVIGNYAPKNSDVFLLRYDENGNLIWNNSWGGNYTEFGYGITVCDDYLYLTGNTGLSMFLLKYDPYDTDNNGDGYKGNINSLVDYWWAIIIIAIIMVLITGVMLRRKRPKL